MQVFLTIATILGLTALFSYLNERFLRLQQTIGLMVLALGFTLLLIALSTAGFSDAFAREQAFVTRLSLDETLLNGVVAFSIIVQGLTISKFFSADQLKRLLS